VKADAIKIVGTGLIGTSLGLSLARHGIAAGLSDHSKANLRLAVEYGAGVESTVEPELIVVCVPPDNTADVVAQELAKHPRAIVTDTASVKSEIQARVRELAGAEATRYIGSHPMAGREKGGPGSARADLFFARPWVITPNQQSPSIAVDLVKDLAMQIGALPIVMTAAEHDRAVALVSHLPQLVASLLAARLVEGEESELNLTGQGLRDTSRIAASDPALWLQILSQNAEAISPLISKLRTDLEIVENSFKNLSENGALARIHSLLERGNSGIARIPGKHGGKLVNYQQLTIVIDDSPGALASLLTFIGEIGVNIEDLKLEHSPGAPIGLVEIQVDPNSAQQLSKQLTDNGWRIV
jgi:prephenate dehydrogenase